MPFLRKHLLLRRLLKQNSKDHKITLFRELCKACGMEVP